MDGWWYARGGERHGPIGEAEVAGLIRDGRVHASTLFWREGMEGWRRLDAIEALRALQSMAPAAQAPSSARDDMLALPEAGPWMRYFARTFDASWEIALVGFLSALLLARRSPDFLELLSQPGGSLLFGVVCFPVAFALDALIFAAVGNTPGKALLGLRVTTADGAKLSFLQYMNRNLGVWAAGYALGVTPAAIVTHVIQHNKVQKREQATWDAKEGYRVRAKPSGWFRKTAFAVAMLALVVGVTVLGDGGSGPSNPASAYGTTFQWQNTLTGRSATIDGRWKYEPSRNKEGGQLFTFTEQLQHASVVFAVETFAGLDEVTYLSAFRRGNKGKMTLDDGQFMDPDDRSYHLRGFLTDNPELIVHVNVRKIGDSYWRVVTVQDKPYDYSNALVAALRKALWSTVPSQGQTS